MDAQDHYLRVLQDKVEVPPEVPQEEETHYLSQSILTILALIAINAIALTYLKKAKARFPVLSTYAQDTTLTTLIGMLAGFYLHFTSQTEILCEIRDGYQDFFLIILLPPIIFESTINMDKKNFFKNIGTILMFAVFGTLIASCLTAFGIYVVGLTNFIPEFRFTLRESFAFGSLISSTDPVTVLSIFKEMNADKTLYSLIFGESILNDAIAIVLYNTVTVLPKDDHGGWITPVVHFALLLTGSMLIGFVIGIFCAIVIKAYFGKGGNNSATNETTLMIVIPWAAYLIGEAFSLSGVVTILFCGISMTTYALPHLSEAGINLTQSLYKTISSTAENLAFIFIGIGFFSFDHHWGDLKAIVFVLSFMIIIVSRYIQITIISFITNLFRKKNQITYSQQMVMSYSGFRGSMAFALAANAVRVFSLNGAGSIMLTLTLVYATLTIFVQGSFLVPIIKYFDIKKKAAAEQKELTSPEESLIEPTPWNKVKGSFQRVEDIITRLLQGWRDNKQILEDEPIRKSKKLSFLSIFRETDLTNLRRIQSESDKVYYVKTDEVYRSRSKLPSKNDIAESDVSKVERV